MSQNHPDALANFQVAINLLNGNHKRLEMSPEMLGVIQESIKNVRTWAKIIYKNDKATRTAFFSKYTRSKRRKEKPRVLEESVELPSVEESVAA